MPALLPIPDSDAQAFIACVVAVGEIWERDEARRRPGLLAGLNANERRVFTALIERHGLSHLQARAAVIRSRRSAPGGVK